MTSFASSDGNRLEVAKMVTKKRQVCSCPPPKPLWAANIRRALLRLQFVQPEPQSCSLYQLYQVASVNYIQTGYLHPADCVYSTCRHIPPSRLLLLLCFNNTVHTLGFFFCVCVCVCVCVWRGGRGRRGMRREYVCT